MFEVRQLKHHRRRVEKAIGQRQHHLRHVALRALISRQRRQTSAFAAELHQLKQGAVEDTDQHLTGLLALSGWHIDLQKSRYRWQSAQRLCSVGCIDFFCASKEPQGTSRRDSECLDQIGSTVFNGALGIALHRHITHGGIHQRLTHHQIPSHAVLIIHRDAQIAERLLRRFTHAQEMHTLSVHIDGQHVVVVLNGLPCGVSQLVGDAGAHVAQVFFGHRLVACTQTAFHGMTQIHCPHIGGRRFGVVGEVFDVDHTQCGELQIELLVTIAQWHRSAYRAFHLKRLDSCVKGHGLQLHFGATIIKARLVNRNPPMHRRVVHFHACGLLFASLEIVNHDLTGKQAGHTGVVVLDDEFLQLHRKRQLLQQHTTGLRQDGRAGHGALGDHEVASERRIGGAQTVLLGHIGDHAAPHKRRLAIEPCLCPHHQVTVEQAPNTHQHNRTVGREITHFVGCTGFGRQHPALALWRVARLQLDFPAPGQQCLSHAVSGGLRRFIQCGLGLVRKSLEALLTDVFFVGLEVGKNFGRVARNTEAGADHQKGQNQQKPPSAVHRSQLGALKHVGPKGAKLIDIVVGRLVLLDHRANH